MGTVAMILRLGASLRRGFVLLLVVPIAFALAALAAGPAQATTPGSLSFTATINGAPTAHSSSAAPVHLYPKRSTTVSLHVTNRTSRRVVIEAVNISGDVVGLSFFSFDTSVDLVVPRDATTGLSFALNMSSLSGQATGLIPGSIKLLNVNGDAVASQSMVTQVRGSLVSVYGLFGLAILILTILAIVDVFLAMARHRMPQNRWRRGLRFMGPGIGIGLVLVFSMSALTLWTPTAHTWLPVAVIFAAAFFVIGYLSPTPLDDEDEDEDDDEDDDEDEGGPVMIKVDGRPASATPAAPATALIGNTPVPPPPGPGNLPS
jgi:hypothetical protein